VNIGEPKRVHEIEPVVLPVPETIPLPQEEPAETPAGPAETPAEPAETPAEPAEKPQEEPVG
jgi:hypothetical protein